MIRVMLVDDQQLVRAGLRMILGSEDDVTIVGEAEDGRRAVEMVPAARPDVILMDVQMPVLDGLAATRQVLSVHADVGARVIILTTFERDDYLFDALSAGASGFLLKNAPPEDIIDAVRVVAAGDALLAPSVTRRVIAEFAAHPRTTGDTQLLESLTDREEEVLRLIARGLSNSEIARQIHLGEATVKTHVSSLLVKLGVRDRVQAVVLAYERGIVRPGQT
jgi:DNA-binding NarL/FixJ family response regulator